MDFELDGRKHRLTVTEIDKAITLADRGSSRPGDPIYNGKSYAWNLRTALRKALRGDRSEPTLI